MLRSQTSCYAGTNARPTSCSRPSVRSARLRPCAGPPGRGADEPDIIEKLVSALFGKKALSDPNPMGMKRLNFDELPDQYVELNEQAAPLASDNAEMRALRPMLARTQLEKEGLRLADDAGQHGWSAQAFHERVDGFGAALLVAQTETGCVCGGYNPEGWISLGEDRASNGAFLFSWPDGDQRKRATKLPKIGGPNLAVIDSPGEGPRFGAEGLTISLKTSPPGAERLAKSRLGTYYERMPGAGRSLFGPGDDYRRTPLKSLRVYVAAGDGVKWELDGLAWKTSKG